MARAVGALRDVDVTGWIGLGYSAGGTALWRAVQQGAPLSHLFCVSSTRLRSEGPIAIPHRVFFGAEDPARPNDAWVRQVPKRATVFDGAAHDYYLDTASRAVRETERRILSDLSDPSTLPNHAK
ncbi:hypothetical protein JANAI62_33360 [Jannaschia pagri]|uniref:Dienelactone hydrolase domain-containing protein n=2 Tax=Roseobacteraceae TaxID=2854170 RepID=A0ABQ4NQN0_9RHOB|nr:hypothetical protein JANAI61_33360 [Jannaschia sp. AI_61]GIT96713.1 hypothetical protein JANAI62_33360 [Jannaschia sp. AI_62]